jgi:Ca2+-binding RTX toxin-like protein
MPTIDVSENDLTLNYFDGASGEPALLISGDRNSIVIQYSARFSNPSGGPAVTITGADNYLRLYYGFIASTGDVAILGSDFADTIINHGRGIEGDIRLQGGNDYFQNNQSSPFEAVYGGTGDDALVTVQGTVSVRYYGEEGADGLRGGTASDMLDGGADADRLYGVAGDDQLFGGTGIDQLDGGAGNDQLSGGGDEGDVAIFDGQWADFDYSIENGSGSITDTEMSDGDMGTDTIEGISILRF